MVSNKKKSPPKNIRTQHLTKTRFRNINAQWVKWLGIRAPERLSSNALASLDSLFSDRLAMRIIAAAGISVLLACFEGLIRGYSIGGLPSVFANAFIVSSLFPASSLVGLMVARNIKISQRPSKNLLAKVCLQVAISNRSLWVKRYPYLSAYAGFACFWTIVAAAPEGLGTNFANFLNACAVDANIAPHGHVDSTFELLVTLFIFVATFGGTQRLIVRLSAGFQMLAVRLIVHRDNFLEALMETTNARSTRIFLPDAHPHLRNISSSFLWLTICYGALFFLVAFCPAPLGTAVLNWLQSSVFDAGFNVDLSSHANVRLFLASIVATFGSVPVAVMSSAFLPIRKPNCLIFSAQGMLSHDNSFTPTLAPLKHWTDLKSVSLSNEGKKNETLKLSFASYGTIKLKTASLERQKVAELLSIADEHAGHCKFDQNVVELRSRLMKDSRAGSLADRRKFSSTIFSTKSGGDYVFDGKYRIVRKVAGKPLSAVYLARDQAHNHVIIKEFVLPTCVQKTESMDESFDREVKALSALKHESIANVIETFEERTAKYLVIEFIEGSDLRAIVQRRGRRDEKKVLLWADQIARLMRFLHSQDVPILHRDLTPDNLMEDANGNIKLIDFGAAHQFMEGVTGTLIGKQCYIAPEQLRGKPSMQSDIYSFGCTLYFLLAGHDPSALEQCDLEAEQIRLQPWLQQLIKRCTEFEPINRYQSFDEIVALIEIKLSRTSRVTVGSNTLVILKEAEVDQHL